MRKRTSAAAAVTVALGGVGSAQAVNIGVTLTGIGAKSINGTSVGNIAASTATWSYDTATGVVTGTGVLDAKFQIGPFATLFDWNAADLAVGGGNVAAASSYACIEGSFGSGVGANLCGQYDFGANFINESSISYGPGTAFSRTIGGDDVAVGPQQNVADFDAMTTILGGTTLTLENGTATSGIVMTFSTVPVPPAAWLFGSALGLLGWARRKRA